MLEKFIDDEEFINELYLDKNLYNDNITYDNFDKFNRNNSRRKFEKKDITIERLIKINDLSLVQFGKHVMSALLHNAYFRLCL